MRSWACDIQKLNLSSKTTKLRTFVTLWAVFSSQVFFFFFLAVSEVVGVSQSVLWRKFILDNRGKTAALPPRVYAVAVCCPYVLRKCGCLACGTRALRVPTSTVSPSPVVCLKCGIPRRRNGRRSPNGALWRWLGPSTVCRWFQTAALSVWLRISIWKGTSSFNTSFRATRENSSTDTLCHQYLPSK